jgi:VanZ family protein
MFNAKPAEHERLSWLLVVLWIVLIYAAIPVARSLQNSISSALGSTVFLWLIAVFFAVLLFLALIHLTPELKKQLPISRLAALMAVGSIFAIWGWSLRSNPERTIHFLQYGMLSILSYRALLHRVSDRSIYPSAILICSITGTIDEMIQWAIPQRHFDYYDILINFGSAFLIQLAIFSAIRPSIVSKPGFSNLPKILNMAALQILLLGFCFSNTPARVQAYIERVPFLSFLKDSAGIMTEYGYRHHYQNVSFYSRLSVEELLLLDSSTGLGAGKKINLSGQASSYHDFLRRYDPVRYPLVYEVRVRLFRRDSYWHRSRKYNPGDDGFHQSINVAWNEHKLLETFFPVTYAASGYMLSEKDKAFFEQNSLPVQRYNSPVSSHLFVRLTELQIWSLLLGLLVLLWIVQNKWASNEET